jgi:hypothetical protein
LPGVIRLTGLPALSRCPDVALRRSADRIEIVFSGPAHEVRMDVDQRYLDDADLEEEELRLLARLGEMGYRVTRTEPDRAGPD